MYKTIIPLMIVDFEKRSSNDLSDGYFPQLSGKGDMIERTWEIQNTVLLDRHRFRDVNKFEDFSNPEWNICIQFIEENHLSLQYYGYCNVRDLYNKTEIEYAGFYFKNKKDTVLFRLRFE